MNMSLFTSGSHRRLLWIILTVVVLDYASKEAILRFLPPHGILLEILPIFNLVLLNNYGAAFGFLTGFGTLANWFLSLLSLGIIGVLIHHMGRFHANNLHILKKPLVAMALVIGGALGNLLDRVGRGSVIDFLDFHIGAWHWPAFNIADSAICIGIFLWVLYEWRASRKAS